MSGRDHDTRAHPKRRNAISGQFAARPIEMLESPAYRAISLSAHMVISRIEVELAHHGGNDNGQLPVTIDQFVEYGMHRSSVAPAIREAEALGFIRVERGRGGNAEYRRPNKFYLTFSNWRGSKAEPPSHDWKHIKSMDQAQSVAREARAAKDRNAVAFGKYAWNRRQSNADLQKRAEENVRRKRAEMAEREREKQMTDTDRSYRRARASRTKQHTSAHQNKISEKEGLRPRYRGSQVFCTSRVVRFFRTGKNGVAVQFSILVRAVFPYRKINFALLAGLTGTIRYVQPIQK
jgi:hypothetical protein